MRLLLLATTLLLTGGLCYAGIRSWQKHKFYDDMPLPDIYRAIVGADEELFV